MKSRNTEPCTGQQAYQYALRLLTGRDYTAARIREKLVGHNVCEHDAEAVVARLQAEGWLDDRRHASRFAETAMATGRFYGPRLKQEMRGRGFAAALVNEVIEPLLSDFDEPAEIRAIMARRYPGFRFSEATDRDKRRIISFLQRRGFGISSIMQVLRSEEEHF